MKEEVVVVDDGVGMQIRPEVDLSVDERRLPARRIQLAQIASSGGGCGVERRVLASDDRGVELSGNVKSRRSRENDDEEEDEDVE